MLSDEGKFTKIEGLDPKLEGTEAGLRSAGVTLGVLVYGSLSF